MKKFNLTLLALLFFVFCNAQFKMVSEGPIFKEPESGYGKILQLKNGGTMFFHITYKDGIDVRVYDEKHAEKAVQTIEPAYGKLKYGGIEAIFEINGDGILLISELDEKRPVLYRLVIDGKKGTLKSETKIAELDKLDMGKGYAMAFGGVPEPGFYVKKDPYSDNYALVLMHSFESDRNKRIEIVFYDKDHKEASRAFYTSPDSKYKYLKYIDMVVIGDKTVNVLAYAYNTKASGGKESELVLATLEKGAKDVSLNELNFTKDYVVTGGLTRYNPVTKRIILVAAAKERAKANSTSYMPFIAFIEPGLGTLEDAAVVYPKKASNEAITLFGDKGEFTGVPQNIFINNDGTFSIVFEEMSTVTTTSSYGSSTTTTLGNIAVSVYDKDGKETAGYLIPKKQKLLNTYLPIFYHSYREGTAQQLQYGNQYKSFSYLAAAKKPYVLINDVEENTERIEKGKITTITGVGECDGFYYPLAAKNALPQRDFVFGAPDRRSHNLALFSISDYNEQTNRYATLKREKGRNEGVSIVWLSPM